MWLPSELDLINSVASVAVGVSVLSGLNPHFLPGGLNASKLLEGHCSIPGSHGLAHTVVSLCLPCLVYCPPKSAYIPDLKLLGRFWMGT